MILHEEHKDLFTVPDDYYLAHCIAEDLRMGAGIAVPMCAKFGLRKALAHQNVAYPTCVLTGRVFNLITKKDSWRKPSYASLELALREMRRLVQENGVKKIAMPRIGCGLDRLEWKHVNQMLVAAFAGTDVEIIVCTWP